MIIGQRIFLDKTIVSTPPADPTKEYRNFICFLFWGANHAPKTHSSSPGLELRSDNLVVYVGMVSLLRQSRKIPVIFADIPEMFRNTFANLEPNSDGL